MKLIISLLFVALSTSACLANLLTDIDKFFFENQNSNKEPVIKDSHEGYDLHHDFYYFDDDLVEISYKRQNFYSNTRVTLAGQRPDMSNRVVKAAVNPFAVAQKCVTRFGQSHDRWDVKENPAGHQFLALYNGQKSTFVINKLRALLLTRLVNELSDYLLLLDRTESEKSDYKKPDDAHILNDWRAILKKQIKEKTESIFRDLDNGIRDQQANSDQSSATATVVIITHNFIITASLGEGQVLAYDGTQRIRRLTDDSPREQDVFGLKKVKLPTFVVEPVVRFEPRQFKDESDEDDDDELYEIQFLVLETPSVSKLMTPIEVERIVLGEIDYLGSQTKREQYLYSNSVERIIQSATTKLNWMKRLPNPDHTVILVGLQTDYSKIH